MLSTDITKRLQYDQELRDLVKYLPTPVETTEIGTKFGVMHTLDIHDMFIVDKEEYLRHQWKNLYFTIIKKLADVFIGRKEYFVIRLLPHVLEDYSAFSKIKIGMIVECFVAQNKNIIIPEFTYVRNTVTEWRCGHCSTPNTMTKRLCTQCGAPRALLLQEIYADLQNGVDVCSL